MTRPMRLILAAACALVGVPLLRAARRLAPDEAPLPDRSDVPTVGVARLPVGRGDGERIPGIMLVGDAARRVDLDAGGRAWLGRGGEA